MKDILLAGTTSKIYQIFIRSTATGAGLTGLVFNSAGLTAYYHRDSDTTATAISLVTMTVGTFTSSGFKEIDATNMPGWYQFCPPNAALAASATNVGFHLQGAANMVDCPIEVDLTGFDLQVATQKVDVDKIKTDSNAATKLQQGTSGIITGTAITGTLSSTQMSCSGNAASATSSIWIGRTIVWTSGVLLGSQAAITAYNGGTNVITYVATQTGASPSNGDTFVIV